MKPRGRGVCYRVGCSREAQYWVRWRRYPDEERACSAHAMVARHVAIVVPIEPRR